MVHTDPNAHPLQGRTRFVEWFQLISPRAPHPLRNGCRGRVHSANLEKLCQVLEVLRVGLQRETGLVPHEEATQHRLLTSITGPDARHDLCCEALHDRLVDLVQCGGLAILQKSPWKPHRVSRITLQARHRTVLTMTQPSSANIRWTSV